MVIVDGRAGDSVVQARQTWPAARNICLLDYISDLELATSLGADECVLKHQGVDALLQCIQRVEARP